MSKLDSVIELIEGLRNDPMVSKNVRTALEESLNILRGNNDVKIKVTKVVYIIEKVSNDQNIMPHIRTRLWDILSELERIVK